MRHQAIISAAAATCGGVGDFHHFCLREKYISGCSPPPDTTHNEGVEPQITARRGNMFVTKHEYISGEISLRQENRNNILLGMYSDESWNVGGIKKTVVVFL